MGIPGPTSLGRGVVITSGQRVPPAWAGAAIHVVDEAALADPGELVAALHQAWACRTPVVIECAVDPGRFREPACEPVAPWTLAADFELALDRLHFLVWANTYDARGDPERPVWWWARKAARLRGVEELPAASGGDARLAGRDRAGCGCPPGPWRGSIAGPGHRSPPRSSTTASSCIASRWNWDWRSRRRLPASRA